MFEAKQRAVWIIVPSATQEISSELLTMLWFTTLLFALELKNVELTDEELMSVEFTSAEPVLFESTSVELIRVELRTDELKKADPISI